MLEFRPITIEDKNLYQKYNHDREYLLADYCFTDLYIWQNIYKTRICPTADYLYITAYSDELNAPIYGFMSKNNDIVTPINVLKEHTAQSNEALIIAYLTQPDIDLIEAQLPNIFRYEEDVDNANYIYLADKLITLSGKKLHSKRNYINRFKQTYTNRWEYKNIEPNIIDSIFKYHLKWCEQNDCTHDDGLFHEVCGVSRALKNFEGLNLKGGVLYLDGNIIAYTLASEGGSDCYTIQIEKADHTIPGAYQMINQQFAEHNLVGVKYINREEDMGLEGLRKSKLSYYPEIILKNYLAYLK